MSGLMGYPTTKPFEFLNSWFSHGTPAELQEAMRGSGYGDDYASDIGAVDIAGALGQGALDHFEDHWLNDAWGDAGMGEALYRGFVHAIKRTGHRPLAAMWVESTESSVSVVDLPGSTLVVVSSPRPEQDDQDPGADRRVTVFPASDYAGESAD